MIYEIVIEKGKVVSYSGEGREWENSELCLVNYLLEEGRSEYASHYILDSIQDYYNVNYGHCCWNFSEKDFEPEEDTNYAKITINGETRYYEEW